MSMTRRLMLGYSAASLALLAGCAARVTQTLPAEEGTAAPAGSPMQALMDRLAREYLHAAPEWATILAVPEERAGGRYIDRLSDTSRAGQARFKAIAERGLTDLRRIDRASLTGQDRVSYQVVETALSNILKTMQFENTAGADAPYLQSFIGVPYVLSQLTGMYCQIPEFLASRHSVRTRDEGEAYITRLMLFARQMDHETQRHREDVAAGVVPPDFAVQKAIAQTEAFTGLPVETNPLIATFQAKLAVATEIADAEKTALLGRASDILRSTILPAYQRQAEALRETLPNATHDAGIWRLARGAALYAAALKQNTSTDMTAQDIHRMGVELVNQIHGEMDAILRAEGLTRGSVAERVREISARPDQIYASTDEGRARVLADLNEQVRVVRTRMPEVMGEQARAPLEIKRIPADVEAASPGGFARPAALDGSRPGAYYINLRDPATEWPRFTLPTLTYHEAIPGHLWQGSLAREKAALPFFRSTVFRFSAYQEGWALYAEQLADEMGMYAHDRLGRLGYLQSAAFRASRLVVDTGMHHLRWSREQAIQSMMAATGSPESSVETEIERYCVWPGQACSYMVGRQAIVAMRERARAAMGARFDLREFHDVVLLNGSVPLSVTESLVMEWAARV
jgi:uncharacterized protein (DUF885 family)